MVVCFFFFLRFYLFIFIERGREEEGEKRQRVVVSRAPSTGGGVTCPGWESNQQPFVLQARTQSTEPHQQGLWLCFKQYTRQWTLVPFRIQDCKGEGGEGCKLRKQLFHIPKIYYFYSSAPKLSMKPRAEK